MKRLKHVALSVMLLTSVIFAVGPSSATAAEDEMQAYITGYSFWDNTPPGSSEISHPVIHREAGGTGTYRNPVTIAVGHSYIRGRDVLDYEEGTRFYIPNLRKYFIVEDTCGDGPRPQNGPCHRLDTPGNSAPRGSEAWLDVWAGGRNSTNGRADACMSRVTGLHTVLIDPEPNYRVVRGAIIAPRSCKTGYGETPIENGDGDNGGGDIPPGCRPFFD